MRVYVVRHGESETNLNKKWTGWMDVPLTDKGREDAEKAGDFLKGVRFDKIITSDLSRAAETARTAIPGCLFETSPLLREYDVGSLAGQPLSVLTGEQRARAAQSGYVDFGGESREAIHDRVRRTMEILEGLSCENVALFTHAGWIREMLDTVIGTRLPRANVRCSNCTVGIFEYEAGIWRLHSWINLT